MAAEPSLDASHAGVEDLWIHRTRPLLSARIIQNTTEDQSCQPWASQVNVHMILSLSLSLGVHILQEVHDCWKFGLGIDFLEI